MKSSRSNAGAFFFSAENKEVAKRPPIAFMC
jgi:hypothetical protein